MNDIKNEGNEEIIDKDEILEEAIKYVVARSQNAEYDYPEGSIRRRAEKVIIKDGQIMYLKKKGLSVRIIQSTQEQAQIFAMCHSDPTSGHFCVKKTFNRLSERFHWKGMYIVQIIHGDSHWVCAANRKCRPWEVEIFDSLHKGKLSLTVKRQLATIMKTLHPKLTITMINVQQQQGYNDCGLFAIAFAVALCNGLDPATLTFQQFAMRSHLKTCLMSKTMTPFPVIKTLRYKKTRVRERDQSDLFCLCRSIWEGESDLCKCVKCTGWHHISCVISINCFTSSFSWRCPLCL